MVGVSEQRSRFERLKAALDDYEASVRHNLRDFDADIRALLIVSEKQEQDAKDAARYRWLRTYWRRVVSHAEGQQIAWMSLHSDNTIATNEGSVDAAIDRAMQETRYAQQR